MILVRLRGSPEYLHARWTQLPGGGGRAPLVEPYATRSVYTRWDDVISIAGRLAVFLDWLRTFTDSGPWWRRDEILVNAPIASRLVGAWASRQAFHRWLSEDQARALILAVQTDRIAAAYFVAQLLEAA